MFVINVCLWCMHMYMCTLMSSEFMCLEYVMQVCVIGLC